MSEPFIKDDKDVGADAYLDFTHRTAVYPRDVASGPVGGAIYPVLKLCSEAGELAQQLGNHYRDDSRFILPEARRQAIKAELGDIAWYWARCCFEFGFDPSEILKANMVKLQSRLERGKLHGEGDNR